MIKIEFSEIELETISKILVSESVKLQKFNFRICELENCISKIVNAVKEGEKINGNNRK